MALYAVYYEFGEPFLNGKPLFTCDLITDSETAAIAKEQELTKAGFVAWYDQIQ